MNVEKKRSENTYSTLSYGLDKKKQVNASFLVVEPKNKKCPPLFAGLKKAFKPKYISQKSVETI
jgi:hypothetical protein